MKITEKEEKLYKEAFDEYVKNQKMPSEEELGRVEFSPEFEEKIQALLKDAKPLRVVTPKKVLMKIASVFIVCSLLASVFVVGIFAEPNDNETTIKDIIELHNSVMYKTDKVRSCYYGFSYLPEGYNTELSGGGKNYSKSGFKNEKEEQIMLIQYMDNIPLPEIDRFGVKYEKIEDGLYIYNINNGKSRYIWSDLGYVFEIRTDNCSKEEILKMSNNLVVI